jgi:hypothetical protein
VSAPLACLVEPGSEDAVQVLHARREVRVAELDDHVEMRREQAIRVENPVVAVDRPTQEPEIHAAQLVTGEHGEAAHPTGRDMVDAVRLLDAKQTRHFRRP